MQPLKLSRRDSLAIGATAIASSMCKIAAVAKDEDFRLRYTVASCMYGYAPVEEVLSQLALCRAESIDLWPKVHGDQREQVDAMGMDEFQQLLEKHKTRVDVISAYRFNIFDLEPEIKFAQSIGCPMLVTMAKGATGLSGVPLKESIVGFMQKLRPHIDIAADHNVTLLIENHSGSMINSVDAIRYLVDEFKSDYVRLALAPAHLPQEPELLGSLVKEVGDRLGFFYAWQHGKGFREKMPREDELLQMPGRGQLDFGPMVRALRELRYTGLVEVMMHPTPRGIPIMPTTAEVTEEITKSHAYLSQLAQA